MLSPSSLCFKNNWGTLHKWWGKIWKYSIGCINYYNILSLLNIDTLSASFQVGISSLCHCPFEFWVIHFASFHLILAASSWPLIPWCKIVAKLWSRVADMFKSLILLQFVSLHTFLRFSVSSTFILFLCLASMMWEKLWPSFDRSLPVDFSSLFGKLI